MTKAFTVEMEGFRAGQLARPPGEIVRELLQNALDAAKSEVRVDVTRPGPGATRIEVTDDGPGFQDLALVTTLYMSDKTDAPTKRGRMGRGLKEAVVVSDHATVETAGGAVEVTRHRKGQWDVEAFPRRKRDQGTRVVLECRSVRWAEAEVAEAVAYLRTVVPPPGTRVIVNGTPNAQPEAARAYGASLPTVVYEEGVERTRTMETRILAYVPTRGAAWLYEMGVPVQTIDHPHSLDVQQRIPMPPHRNTVSPGYLRVLYAAILNQEIEEGRDPGDAWGSTWAMEAAQKGGRHLTEETKRGLVAHFTKGLPVSRTRAEQHEAENFRIRAIPLKEIPEAVRGVVAEVAPRTKTILDDIGTAETHVLSPHELRPKEARLARCWELLLEAAGFEGVTVRLSTGKPSFAATFNEATRVLTIYRENVGTKFFEHPFTVETMGLLNHETSHWKHSTHKTVHGYDFHSDVEHMAARLAIALWRNGDAILTATEGLLEEKAPA